MAPAADEKSRTSGPDQSRSRIIAAAALAFMEKGYSATSIDVVAARLGATKGHIYHYYHSKADLFFDVHREAMQLNLDTVRPLLQAPGEPVERMRGMLLAHAYLIMDHLPLQRVAMEGVEMHLSGSTTPAQRSTLRALIQMRDKYESLFLTVIDEGIAKGQLRKADPRTIVKPILGALNWMTVWYRPRRGDSDASRRRIAEETADFILHGVIEA